MDGKQVVRDVFTSATKAVEHFIDHAFDFDSVALGSDLGANTLSFQAKLQVRGSKFGSGFFLDLIFGDPPYGGVSTPPLWHIDAAR